MCGGGSDLINSIRQTYCVQRRRTHILRSVYNKLCPNNTMSDSTKSSVGFLSNWKFNLAVCIPCFAVGLGAVTYYFYSKSQAKHNDIDTNTVKIHNQVGFVVNIRPIIFVTCISFLFLFFILVFVQTPSEKVKELKKLGNVEFVKQNYDSAIDIYTQALSMCPEFEKRLMSNLYYNRANAYNKLVINNYL